MITTTRARRDPLREDGNQMVPHPVQVSAGRPGAAGPARTSNHPGGPAYQPVSAAKTAGPAQAAGSALRARPV